jgi:cholinesterase
MSTQESAMYKAMISLLICMLLVGCSAATPAAMPTNTPAPKIAHIAAFGDSYSDNGNFYKIATELAKNNLMDPSWWPWAKIYYWEGPVTNQPPAVEILADRLNVDLNDFAVGGANSGYSNANDVVDLFKNTGLLGQVDKYKTGLAGQQADPETLFFIQISANDFLTLGTHDAQKVSDAADQAVANIGKAVTNLAESGARQIMVANSVDLSRLPGVISEGYVNEAAAFQTRINSTLPGEMEKLAKQLDVTVTIFDYSGISERIRGNADQYGLTNLTEECVYFPKYETCKSPDEYYFWDEYHPTSRVQQIIGEAMADDLMK